MLALAVPADQIMPLGASIQKCDTIPSIPMTNNQKIQVSRRLFFSGTRNAMGRTRYRAPRIELLIQPRVTRWTTANIFEW